MGVEQGDAVCFCSFVPVFSCRVIHCAPLVSLLEFCLVAGVMGARLGEMCGGVILCQRQLASAPLVHPASGGFRGIRPSFASSSPWRWVTAVGGLKSDVVKRQQALEGCLLFNTWWHWRVHNHLGKAWQPWCVHCASLTSLGLQSKWIKGNSDSWIDTYKHVMYSISLCWTKPLYI